MPWSKFSHLFILSSEFLLSGSCGCIFSVYFSPLMFRTVQRVIYFIFFQKKICIFAKMVYFNCTKQLGK